MIWFLILFSPLFYWIFKFIIYERHLRKFSGPTPWPLLGSALEINSTKKVMDTFLKYRKRYQENFRLYVGFEPAVVISEVKSMEYFLSNTNANAYQKKPRLFAFFRKWLKNGLILSDGEYWKRHRRIVTPAFNYKTLKEYVKIFDSIGNALVNKMGNDFDKTIDVYPLAKLASLDAITGTAMGSPIGALVSSDISYMQSVERVKKIGVDRVFSVLGNLEFLYQFTNRAKAESESLKIIHGYSRSAIQKRRNELTIQSGPHDFLNHLLTYSTQGDTLTFEEVQEEVDTIMFAGHDTTASALSFTLYCISKDERVQAKIIEELSSIFGDDTNKPTTYEDLQQMKYLEQVIKESLRLYPPIPFHFREITNKLICDGKVYPKGLILVIYIYALHHNPNYFKDPELFYPERFETESNPYRSGGSFSYLPFGAGPRMCIGQKFALLELKSLVSKVLRHYVLKPCKDHQLELANETVLVSLNGVPIRIFPRS